MFFNNLPPNSLLDMYLQSALPLSHLIEKSGGTRISVPQYQVKTSNNVELHGREGQ